MTQLHTRTLLSLRWGMSSWFIFSSISIWSIATVTSGSVTGGVLELSLWCCFSTNPLALHFNYTAPPCSHVLGLPEEWMSGWPHASWLLLYSVGLKVRWRRKTCSRLCCGPQAYCCWRLLQESTYCKCQPWSDAAQRVWKPGPSMLFPEKVLVHHQHTAVESTAPSRAFTAHWGRKAYSFSPQGMIIAWSVVWFSES